MDVMALVWKVGPPVASGVAGVFSALWRLTQTIEKRVADLERFKTEKYPFDMAAMKTILDGLREHINKEIEDLYTELRGRSRERLDARRLQTKLSERYLAMEGRVEALEKTLDALNTSFVEHAKGQNDQWQEISRALGQLEGWLRATSSSRRSSQEFTAPTVPKR